MQLRPYEGPDGTERQLVRRAGAPRVVQSDRDAVTFAPRGVPDGRRVVRTRSARRGLPPGQARPPPGGTGPGGAPRGRRGILRPAGGRSAPRRSPYPAWRSQIAPGARATPPRDCRSLVRWDGGGGGSHPHSRRLGPTRRQRREPPSLPTRTGRRPGGLTRGGAPVYDSPRWRRAEVGPGGKVHKPILARRATPARGWVVTRGREPLPLTVRGVARLPARDRAAPQLRGPPSWIGSRLSNWTRTCTIRRRRLAAPTGRYCVDVRHPLVRLSRVLRVST